MDVSILICCICVLFLIGIVLYLCLRSPYHYPYKVIRFDITGKRSPQIEDLIDRYINTNGFDRFAEHYDYVDIWKAEKQAHAEASLFSNLRKKQLTNAIDDDSMFIFKTIRKQTRYTQRNYRKTSYKVSMPTGEYFCNYHTLLSRYYALEEIEFAHTLSEVSTKEQRRLMTKALRDQIAFRDHYTCQLCGKYMPDGVGLQIDHIIPIAKGGKSIPSNLQVLCSKCNGKKSNK